MKHEANVHELFSKKKVVNLLNEGIAKKNIFIAELVSKSTTKDHMQVLCKNHQHIL